jgi:hypothetical protein
MPVVADIHEVAEHDTEVAFETYERFHMFADPVTNEHLMEKVQDPFEMRAYDGRLYRKLFETSAVENSGFHIAFDDATAPKAEDPGAAISTGFGYYGTNPLASAIRRQIEWDLEKTSLSDSNVVTAWPSGRREKAREQARTTTEFPAIMYSIENLDAELMELSQQRIEKQIAKLLVIGDELWVESRPPSWRVEVVENAVTLDLAIAIEGFDPILSRRHFPIDRLQDAQAYARLCATPRPSEDRQYTVTEYVVEYEALVSELLNFDADAEELSRISYALAFESMRYARRNHGWMANTHPTMQNILRSAYEATLATDYVRGQLVDIEEQVEDICNIWKRFNRPAAWCEIGPVRGRFGDMLMKRAHELAENAPIALDGNMSKLPSRWRVP